jgi:hypothetical protein
LEETFLLGSEKTERRSSLHWRHVKRWFKRREGLAKDMYLALLGRSE